MGVAAAKPLVLHEQNAVAGLANRVLAYGADRILTGFPRAFAGRHARKVDWVGNPVREAFGRFFDIDRHDSSKCTQGVGA